MAQTPFPLHHDTRPQGWARPEVALMAGGGALGLVIGGLAGFVAQGGTGVAAAVALGLLPTLGGVGLAVVMRRHRATGAMIEAQAHRLAELERIVASLAEDKAEISRPANSQNDEMADKIRQIASAQQKTEKALAIFMSARSTPQPPAPSPAPTAAPMLPFTDEPDLNRPLSLSDLILAVNFPPTVDDRAGFAAMRAAMRDGASRPLILAAQDLLTLLSQDGIYMDDLTPDRARPEVWRRFAEGQRGHAIAALGGIQDRQILDRIAGRMRSDPIFRDTAHHFLRQFDRLFAAFAESADDAQIAQFGETRSARAFMLLARVAGTFD